MNYWIFVIKDGWIDKHSRKWAAEEIIETLRKDSVWGIGDKTPNRKKLAGGDRVVIYQAGKNSQRFIGSGILSSSSQPYKQNSSFSLGTDSILDGWGNYVTLESLSLFPKPLLLSDLAEELCFIGRKETAANHFQSGVRSITEKDYQRLTQGNGSEMTITSGDSAVEDKNQFVLEKYLQEFIESNWMQIDFGENLEIYQDENENTGVQYTTDVGYIDILSVDSQGDFVVIELKKGRESDKVVGQILRYIGWVKQNLAKNGQDVRGIIICSDFDKKMQYAISVISSVSIMKYSVSFNLYSVK